MTAPRLALRLPGTPTRRAWATWIVFTCVICALVAARPHRSHVTLTYFPTAATWWEAEAPIYTEGIAGYLYPPQSLYLFSPFLAFPEGAPREVAWRLFGLALFAFGLARFVRRVRPPDAGVTFEITTLLVLVGTASSARNGQTNLHLAGALLHAASELVDRRHTRATLWLLLALLAKPLALVPILLAGALVAPMRWRLLVGLAAFAVLPLLHVDLEYASSQYRDALSKLARSAQPGTKPYEDLVGLLRTIGLEPPQAVRTALGLVFALGALLWLRFGLRRSQLADGAWLWGAVAAAYLMLFNPRTETNSYVILVPWAALLAAAAWRGGASRGVAILLSVGCVLLGADTGVR
ncbi:MAG: hypothetical protein O2894_13000, partial [Planctomycetota bacterium]|nr:hypothetical protein [Planctomycetota bacterium]